MKQLDPKVILNQLAPPSIKYFWRVNYDMSFEIWSRKQMFSEISSAIDTDEFYVTYDELSKEFRHAMTFADAKNGILAILNHELKAARTMISILRSTKCPK